jgi:hypothetical protein
MREVQQTRQRGLSERHACTDITVEHDQYMDIIVHYRRVYETSLSIRIWRQSDVI